MNVHENVGQPGLLTELESDTGSVELFLTALAKLVKNDRLIKRVRKIRKEFDFRRVLKELRIEDEVAFSDFRDLKLFLVEIVAILYSEGQIDEDLALEKLVSIDRTQEAADGRFFFGIDSYHMNRAVFRISSRFEVHLTKPENDPNTYYSGKLLVNLKK